MSLRFRHRARQRPLPWSLRRDILGPYPRYMADAIWERERDEAFSKGKFSACDGFYPGKHADQRWFKHGGRYRHLNGWLRYA